MEFTPQLVQFSGDPLPHKISTQIFILQKKIIFLKIPKNIIIQIFEQNTIGQDDVYISYQSTHPCVFHHSQSSVNSEIFARDLFSRNFAYAKFRENKILAKSLCRLLM